MSSMSATDTAASVKEIGQRWWLLTVFGVITVGFGIVLTFKPGKSVHAIAIIIGIWLLILGVVELIRAIGASGERTGFVIVGLLAIVIALSCCTTRPRRSLSSDSSWASSGPSEA